MRSLERRSRPIVHSTRPRAPRSSAWLVLLGEYWEIAQRVRSRKEEANLGLRQANEIYRYEEFPHRQAHPEYVDPLTLPDTPGLHYGTASGKRPPDMPRTVQISNDPRAEAAAHVRSNVRAELARKSVELPNDFKIFIP